MLVVYLFPVVYLVGAVTLVALTAAIWLFVVDRQERRTSDPTSQSGRLAADGLREA
jgi:hypothetical protein